MGHPAIVIISLVVAGAFLVWVYEKNGNPAQKIGKLIGWFGVIVADGTPAAAKRLERVLKSDPAMGILRHADAGYDEAIKIAREKKVKIHGNTCHGASR